MLPIYDKSIIYDFNSEGFDSVESEDFDYPEPPVTELVLPEMIDNRSADEKEFIRMFYMTDQEKEIIERKFLLNHGIDF